jgi:mRNA deadenylase 3'-5' endonuclease subunit Ccr4
MIRLFSLNMGQGKVPGIIQFVKKTKSDIVCLQEIWEKDFEMIKKELGMKGLFASVAQKNFREDPMGLTLLVDSKFFISEIDQFCYAGHHSILPPLIEGDMRTANWLFLYVKVNKRKEYTIGTTHFIWTPDGKPDKLQREGLKTLLKFLETFPEIAFCGDFNAPRGGEIFSAFAKRYKDNIPLKYKTSIDPLHKGYARYPVLRENCMVDGVFSTPGYRVRKVVLCTGLSDHCAVIAEIYKN